MNNNVLAEALVSEEERLAQEQIEQIKYQGYKYFRVYYIGRQPAEVMKIQGLKAIVPYRASDQQTGEEIWKGREGAAAYFFHKDGRGRKYTDIWDDPDQYNRAFFARHIGSDGCEYEIEDKRLEKQILALVDIPYKVELSEEEELEKDIANKQKRLKSLQRKSFKENPAESKPKPVVRKRRRRSKLPKKQPEPQPQEVAQEA